MSVHDNLVKSLITHLKSEGFTGIKADLEGYDQPESIYWDNKPNEKFIPDATADKNKTPFIFDIETDLRQSYQPPCNKQ